VAGGQQTAVSTLPELVAVVVQHALAQWVLRMLG
jgi:hypothetical protein